MKSVIRLATKLSMITLAISFSIDAYASDHVKGLTCEGKKQTIEFEIQQAKNHNDKGKIEGLQKALQELNQHCSNQKLEAKYQQTIAEKTKKVAENKDKLAKKIKELAKNNKQSNQQKIDKLRTKLNEAEQELAQAKQTLADYYHEIKAK